MLRRKVRDHDDAVALLAALARSGLSRADFCQRHRIDGRSLHCWELNLDRRRPRTAEEAPALRLLEVAIAPRLSAPATYRVHVGDLVVELGDDFVDATLARLVGVLSAC